MKFPMVAYGVLAIILLVTPLLVVTAVLIKVRGTWGSGSIRCRIAFGGDVHAQIN